MDSSHTKPNTPYINPSVASVWTGPAPGQEEDRSAAVNYHGFHGCLSTWCAPSHGTSSGCCGRPATPPRAAANPLCSPSSHQSDPLWSRSKEWMRGNIWEFKPASNMRTLEAGAAVPVASTRAGLITSVVSVQNFSKSGMRLGSWNRLMWMSDTLEKTKPKD